MGQRETDKSEYGTQAKSIHSLSNVARELSKNSRPSTTSKVVAVLNPSGRTTLGVDVEAFIEYYSSHQ